LLDDRLETYIGLWDYLIIHCWIGRYVKVDVRLPFGREMFGLTMEVGDIDIDSLNWKCMRRNLGFWFEAGTLHRRIADPNYR